MSLSPNIPPHIPRPAIALRPPLRRGVLAAGLLHTARRTIRTLPAVQLRRCEPRYTAPLTDRLPEAPFLCPRVVVRLLLLLPLPIVPGCRAGFAVQSDVVVSIGDSLRCDSRDIACVCVCVVRSATDGGLGTDGAKETEGVVMRVCELT